MPVRFGEATRIQADLLRRLGRVPAIIVGCAGVVLGLELLQARFTTMGSPLESLASVRVMLVGFLALAWGASAWRGEGPKNRQYFLGHPVDATAHELSRIAAGALWLMVGVAAATIVAVAGALVRKDATAFSGGIAPWLGLFTGSLLIYLVVVAIATLTSRVAEVLIISYLSLILVIPLLALANFGKAAGRLFAAAVVGSYGVRAALLAPRTAEASSTMKWLAALVIWYAVAGLMVGAVLWWRRGRLANR
jgi:hypothetical protein